MLFIVILFSPVLCEWVEISQQNYRKPLEIINNLHPFTPFKEDEEKPNRIYVNQSLSDYEIENIPKRAISSSSKQSQHNINNPDPSTKETAIFSNANKKKQEISSTYSEEEINDKSFYHNKVKTTPKMPQTPKSSTTKSLEEKGVQFGNTGILNYGDEAIDDYFYHNYVKEHKVHKIGLTEELTSQLTPTTSKDLRISIKPNNTRKKPYDTPTKVSKIPDPDLVMREEIIKDAKDANSNSNYESKLKIITNNHPDIHDSKHELVLPSNEDENQYTNREKTYVSTTEKYARNRPENTVNDVSSKLDQGIPKELLKYEEFELETDLEPTTARNTESGYPNYSPNPIRRKASLEPGNIVTKIPNMGSIQKVNFPNSTAVKPIPHKRKDNTENVIINNYETKESVQPHDGHNFLKLKHLSSNIGKRNENNGYKNTENPSTEAGVNKNLDIHKKDYKDTGKNQEIPKVVTNLNESNIKNSLVDNNDNNAEDAGDTKVNPMENLLQFVKVVADTISRNTRRSFKSKVRYLEELKHDILGNIASRIESAWPDESPRQARAAESRGHVELPSSESALMTISFLTFAVFLIKLVLQVIHTYKNKTMMMTPAVVATVRRAAKTFRNHRN